MKRKHLPYLFLAMALAVYLAVQTGSGVTLFVGILVSLLLISQTPKIWRR